MNRIILDLCGGTGAWSKPYFDSGYDVRLITLPEYDVLYYEPPNSVWGILAAPPCTEFSFAKHFHGKGNYHHNFESGMQIVNACLRIVQQCKPKWWCLENPVGYLRRFMGQPVFSFSPWQFGDNYKKRTDLWGNFTFPKPTVNNLPDNLIKFSMLKSKEIHPELYGKLSRQERRAVTPQGFASAFFKANP